MNSNTNGYCSYLFLHCVVIALSIILISAGAYAQSPNTAPLIQSNNLSLVGTFKLPTGNLGSPNGFGYAGTGGNGTGGVTYNPANNSLFIGGHPYDQRIAEIAIPSSLSGTATALQNLIDPLEGKLGSINPSDPGSKLIGSAFVYNNQLYIGAFSFYDASHTQTKSQFVRPMNLSTKGQVQGPFQISGPGQDWLAKYATPIPAEWQSAFGGQVLVGGSLGNINATQSWGPAASVINPSDIGSENPVPATLVLGYPMSHPLNPATAANSLLSQADKILGVAFPTGTRSVLFFGKHGMGAYCYGDVPPCNDPTDSSKGVHTYPYRSQVWAYDANDLVAVKNGQKQSWEVQPYAVWQLDSSFDTIQGVGYDPTTQRIFVSAVCEDTNCAPLIKVYQVNNVTGSPTATAPTLTLTANPLSVLSGVASTLTWSSTNATSCNASGAWSGSKATSGTQSTGVLSVLSTFSLTCTGTGGSTTQSATVAINLVTPAPTVSISANPTTVASGSSSTLSWSSTNATACTASGAWSGSKATSGTQSTGALTTASSYSLSCTGLGGSANQSTTVAVTSTPPPPPQGSTISVSNVSALQSAIAGLTSNQTVALADGTYNLTGTLFLPQNLSNVTIKGASGNRDAVIIKGPGMTNAAVSFAFWADNINGITIQDMTLRDFYQHAIILNGNINSPLYRNLHIIDIGDQFLKNNPTSDNLNGIDNGILEKSLLEYSSIAPDSYTNGVDVHRGKNWIIRDNTFKNFRSTGSLAGPAVLIWNGSSDSTVVRNTFINNQRDIALGLDPAKPADSTTDHARGVIANNFVYKTSSISPDVSIAIFDSPQTKVYHNTVLVNGSYPNAIEYRFSGTTGLDIKNNLTDAAITARDGANATVAGNVTNASSTLFVGPATGDLHLNQTATSAIDKAVAVDVTDDIDGQTRPQGIASDIGADEFSTSVATPAAPSNLVLQ